MEALRQQFGGLVIVGHPNHEGIAELWQSALQFSEIVFVDLEQLRHGPILASLAKTV